MTDEILSDQEMVRYCRQILLPACDIDGQEKLKLARVLVIGIGGLGCAAAQYLGAAGVGQLTLVDFDQVELSNLQRQILHTTANIGDNKAQSGQAALQAINPEINVIAIDHKVEGEQLAKLCAEHDVIVDCCDNLATRSQLNELCFRLKRPLVSGAAIRMEGMVSCFDYSDDSPCYQCFSQFFGEQQLSCMEAGVLSPAVGIVGSIQAAEVIKIISGIGRPLIGRILLADIAAMSFCEMKLKKSAQCQVCS
ncbi:MAG: molybdopterin-synthase adenylyltransferase MoeB [Gammaproteobacteria bacterium]|nr:molybdopterin-synthase adenylyltransferase MoeB [Gammaproteobacteria bacterium]